MDEIKKSPANITDLSTNSIGEGVVGGQGNQGVTTGSVGSKVRGDRSRTGGHGNLI